MRKEVLAGSSVVLRLDVWKRDRNREPVGYTISQPDPEALRADVSEVRLDVVARIGGRSQVVLVDEDVAVTERERRFPLRRQPGLRSGRRRGARGKDTGEKREQRASD